MKKITTDAPWLQDIKNKLVKHADKIEFNDFEHSYILKRTGKVLTSVSNTLTFFNKGLDDVPTDILETAKQRGNIIHAIAEHTMKEIFPRRFTITPKEFEEEVMAYAETVDEYDSIQHSHYVMELLAFISTIYNWEPISIELPLYNAKASIAGTPDLVIAMRHGSEVAIRVIDWKTGNIRVSSYAQVSIYQAMLKGALKSLKTTNVSRIIYSTEVVSLKTGELSHIQEVKHGK